MFTCLHSLQQFQNTKRYNAFQLQDLKLMRKETIYFMMTVTVKR